jgi:hypothetical protein
MQKMFMGKVAIGAAVCALLGLLAAANGRQDALSAVQVSAEKAFTQATWRISASWNNGVSGTFDMTFRDDGTCYTGTNTGRFFQIGPRYVWAFNGVSGVPDWSITYAGEVSPNGTTLTGIQGWSHTSGKPMGTHSGSRAFTFVGDKAKLGESASGIALGQQKQ